VFKIISGGQTGADRAALDVALRLKIACGGWCPGDRRAEDGVIPACYPLKPLRGAGYRRRTRQNVIDSDGTVISSFGALTGGSKTTAGFAKLDGKPVLVIDAKINAPTEAAVLLAVFLLKYRIGALNVAGPRASKQTEIYWFVRDALMALFGGKRRGVTVKPRAVVAGSGAHRK
jgi:hypothetical protein